MKKSLFVAISTLLLSSCGVGIHSVQSGVEDAAYLSFTDIKKQEIVVTVDNSSYTVETVKQKPYKSGRNIKKTALNTIKIKPGEHNVTVTLDGNQVYKHKIFISTGENRIIEL